MLEAQAADGPPSEAVPGNHPYKQGTPAQQQQQQQPESLLQSMQYQQQSECKQSLILRVVSTVQGCLSAISCPVELQYVVQGAATQDNQLYVVVGL